MKLSEVVVAGCAFAEKHGQKVIHVDHHLLQAAREHLPKGYALSPVPGGQDALVERHMQVRKGFREGNIDIPGPMKKLLGQLALIIGKPKPGGGTQIILPKRAGTHLDLAAAFVVAGWAARFATHGETKQPKGVKQRQMANTGGY